jgi:hypothetical protein
MSTLIKETYFTFDPGSPYVPGSPGTPYSPERLIWEPQVVCGLEPNVPGHWEYIISGYSSTRIFVPDAPYPGVGVYISWVCRTELVPVHVLATAYVPPTPAIPGVASSLITDYNLGWNAGARSIEFFRNDGFVEFTVPGSTVGACVGLSTTDDSATYVDIDHAFYVARDVARIYERGIERLYIGASAGVVYRIQRAAGVVTYYVDDVLVYTSALTTTLPAFLDASMYAGGDTVTDAIIDDLANIAISLPTLSVLAGDAYASCSISMRTLLLLGGDAASTSPNLTDLMEDFASGLVSEGETRRLAGIVATANLSIAPLQILGGSGDIAGGTITIAPITIDAGSALAAPPYALASIATGYLTLAGTGLAGAFGGADVETRSLLLLGGEGSYADSQLSLPSLIVYGSTYEGLLEGSLLSGASVATPLAGDYVIVVLMDVDLSVSAVLAVQLTKTATMDVSLSMNAALTAIISQLAVSMSNTLSITTGAPPTDEDTQAWVLNMDNEAVSTYENFGFNSFAKLGDEYFGCKADGLFVLDGDTDDGALIRASINYGKQDFGSKMLKRPEYAYIGVSSTGTMYVKLTANGTAYTYAARRADADLSTQRVEFGRGISANYMQFEIYNHDGGDFELDSVEFHYVELTRRI